MTHERRNEEARSHGYRECVNGKLEWTILQEKSIKIQKFEGKKGEPGKKYKDTKVWRKKGEKLIIDLSAMLKKK